MSQGPASQRVLLSPSILSADWTRLREQIELAEQGADWLHLDVMDGQFVPNLTFGPLIVRAIRRMTRLPLDVHLMIQDPGSYASAFRDAGADWLSVHVEARGVAGPGWPAPARSHGEGARDEGEPPSSGPIRRVVDPARLRASLATLRATGARVGLALRPDTAVAEVEAVLGELDLLLVMSVYPGFSGQPFREEALTQIRAAAERRDAVGARFLVEVDGGVAADTMERVVEAGADVIVSGHGIYRQPDPIAAMRELATRAAAARARARAPGSEGRSKDAPAPR